MKIKKCRSCSSSSLKNAFDLGSQKLTGVFPKTLNENIPSGSLAMVFCEKCKLLQLENSFNASMMYGDNYGYMSSLNPHMINHLKNKAKKLNSFMNLTKDDVVIDIGSNDGTFLNFFSSRLKLIGIDLRFKECPYFVSLAGVLDIVIAVPGHIGHKSMVERTEDEIEGYYIKKIDHLNIFCINLKYYIYECFQMIKYGLRTNQPKSSMTFHSGK